jgi:malonyl-CoA/methylmalonyl-CoA synthetase
MAPIKLDDLAPSTDMLAAWSKHMASPVVDVTALRRDLTSGPTLHDAFSATARRYARSKALTLGDVTLSHGEVEEESERAAGLMAAWGIGPGTRVALLADTRMSVVIAYLGALRAGAIVTFVNPTYTSAEMAQVLDLSDTHAALATGDSLGGLVTASPECSVIGLEAGDRDRVPDVLGAREPAPIANGASNSESTAVLALTSGTTGDPKPVPLSHRNLLASIRGVIWAWRWRSDDLLIHCLPIAHQHGLGAVHIALLTGSHALILSGFDPDGLITAMRRTEATAFFAVPAIYERLLAEAPKQMSALSALRVMTSGSAALPAELAFRIEEATGQLPVERYGLTETGLDVSNPIEGPRIPGTVGLALPGIELALVGEGMEVLGRGEAGEVVFRGPQVFGGYVGDVDGESFIEDWFRTGDIGVIDEESGHLRLVGRSKEVIITGGMNVYPREVESALLGVPGVIDAAVIGVPSARWGEAVTAFVVTSGVSTDQVSDAVRSHLAPFKRPKQVISVDSIPRTEVGKLRRDVLASSPSIDRI